MKIRRYTASYSEEFLKPICLSGKQVAIVCLILPLLNVPAVAGDDLPADSKFDRNAATKLSKQFQ